MQAKRQQKVQTVTIYDMSESMRQSSAWVGATTKAFWQNPAFSVTMSPLPALFSAWGEVTERTFEKVATKPSWGIDSVVSADSDYPVTKQIELELPFCNLIHFTAERDRPVNRRVLLVAPMSGHYATLCRKTVASLLPNCDVYVTEWKNARDVPLSAGKFDVEDYTKYVVKMLRHLGENIHIIAVCQPVPLTLVATAMLAEDETAPQPRTLTLIGGPVDPDANPTEVTDFGNRVTMGQLEHSVITPVGFAFAGVGRKVYPGAVQLSSFIAMNAQTHAKAFADQIGAVARGEAADLDRHNKFYDEYLAVMDMPAEFYLSTVDRVFKRREVARNVFKVDGRHVDISKITKTAVKIVEGGRDDISAPGQCLAALDLLPDLPEDMQETFLAPDAGHYGIFSGSAWRNDIRPAVLNFIDKHNDAPEAPVKAAQAPKAQAAATPAKKMPEKLGKTDAAKPAKKA
ncbi:MAG: polyhydroxyalkanoate depolymerase [Rhodobacteraceae bacterium]|nr:polyhydroxyalkanoate depolymerase [Paracoccaceae bacterium]